MGKPSKGTSKDMRLKRNRKLRGRGSGGRSKLRRPRSQRNQVSLINLPRRVTRAA